MTLILGSETKSVDYSSCEQSAGFDDSSSNRFDYSKDHLSWTLGFVAQRPTPLQVLFVQTAAIQIATIQEFKASGAPMTAQHGSVLPRE